MANAVKRSAAKSTRKRIRSIAKSVQKFVVPVPSQNKRYHMKKIPKIGLLICVILAMSFTWPPKLDKKVRTTISKTFQIETFQLDEFQVTNAIEKSAAIAINKHLYTIHQDDINYGYIYVGEAPSMKNVFDYAILFSTDLKIINAKVLIYREKHGRQIGMKRWLKQFFGMKPGDSPTLGENIDGISGATISCTSMTKAVEEVLKGLDYLKNNIQL